MCDAEIRNKQALFVLENEWGCGRIDVGRMKHLLRGEGTPYADDDCEESDAHPG